MIERLSEFIKYLNISVRRFEQSISASDGMIRRAINNNTDIQSKWIQNISDKYPELNLGWLVTGKGEMLRNIVNDNTINYRILLLMKHFGLSTKTFSTRIGLSDIMTMRNIVMNRENRPSFDIIEKIILSFDNISAEWLITGKGNMYKSDIMAPPPRSVYPSPTPSPDLVYTLDNVYKSLLETKDAEISRLNREIGALQEQLRNARQ